MLSPLKLGPLLALLLIAQPAAAQEPARRQPPLAEAQLVSGAAPGPRDALFLAISFSILKTELERQAFWDAPERAHAAATAQLIAERNPFVQALLRIRGMDLAVWNERRPFDLERAPELNPDWLAAIRDGTGMPAFRNQLSNKRSKADAVENAYCQAVVFANQTPFDAFVKSAEDNKYVTFGSLWRDSERYRGQVVPVKGELLRLRREDAPFRLQVMGVKYLYEGWIKGPTDKSFPFCVVFPIPPEDKSNPTGLLEPAETMRRQVTFYGYYFKKLRYPVHTGEGVKLKTAYLDSPMLIGPTLIVTDQPHTGGVTAPAPFSKHLYMIVGGLACIVIVMLGGLSWWFRHGDRQFRDRVRALQSARAIEMFEEQAPESAEPGGAKPHDA